MPVTSAPAQSAPPQTTVQHVDDIHQQVVNKVAQHTSEATDSHVPAQIFQPGSEQPVLDENANAYLEMKNQEQLHEQT